MSGVPLDVISIQFGSRRVADRRKKRAYESVSRVERLCFRFSPVRIVRRARASGIAKVERQTMRREARDE